LLARYNPNGTFDPSFGYGGMTAIALPPAHSGIPSAHTPLFSIIIAGNRLYAYGFFFFNGIGSGYLAAFQLPSQAQPANTAPTVQGKAIQEKVNVKKLQVVAAPNPASTHFVLRLQGGNNEPVQIRVTDAMGRVVELRKKVNANSTITLGATYRAGVYYAEVMQGSKKITVKLVKGSN